MISLDLVAKILPSPKAQWGTMRTTQRRSVIRLDGHVDNSQIKDLKPYLSCSKVKHVPNVLNGHRE